MIKLIASDLDGTIIDNNNQISSYDLEAINKLNHSNVNFAVCTGKTYSMTKNLCKDLKATYGIFGNGTQIINLKTGEEIVRNNITNIQAKKCINIANENNLHCHIYTDDKIISQKSLKYIAYRNYQLYKENVKFEIVDSLKEYIEQESPSILKLVISSTKDLGKVRQDILSLENLEAIQIKKYDRYKDKIIDEEYEYLDIVPKNITKYSALKQLGNYLNISNQEVMAVGDNMNDIEMIENVGIGVAIGGSYEDVINKAKYVTKNTVKTGGFAEAVYKFIEM